MTEELHDTTQPAGWVWKVDPESGEGVRNDGRRLKPAAKNPWYVLVTIAGEQGDGFDAELHARNRRFWNGWACSRMDAEKRAQLAEKMDLPVAELEPLSEDELAEVTARFRERLGAEAAIPGPSAMVDFSDTHFPMTLGMGKCVLAEISSFESVRFSGDARFVSATFSRGARFVSATFSGVADFSNKAFEARTLFREARFLGGVPRFYQRELHQDTTFTAKDGYWPEITDKNAEDSKQAYTRLRQVMNGLQKPDDEHFFFRQEMRCKARLEGRFYGVVSKAFEVMSDYGYSVGRPLGGLLAVIGLGWGFIGSYLQNAIGAGATAPGAIWAGLGISFSNTFAFFGFGRTMLRDFYATAPAWLDTLSGAQTVLGFVLLFFLGLGLRNRFRLK